MCENSDRVIMVHDTKCQNNDQLALFYPTYDKGACLFIVYCLLLCIFTYKTRQDILMIALINTSLLKYIQNSNHLNELQYKQCSLLEDLEITVVIRVLN